MLARSFRNEASLPKDVQEVVDKAADALKGPEPCDLEPLRPGIPDEALVELLAYRDGQRCRFRLWEDDEQWTIDAGARAASRALNIVASWLRGEESAR
ncbi:MAG: hypothetical protein H6729_08185 [Deltaproteobacteria bacterium]|nr:hypothetical protein [Deltaproteobacteria bacterium]